MYKINDSETLIFRIFDSFFIPQNPANSDYQKFIQDVAEQGIEIVEGPDIIEPSYIELRQQEYPSLQEQQDMQYWDQLNATTIWQDTITEIKEKYPKTITGGTTIGPVPDWVQEAADNWTFNKQLNEYVTALENLPKYILENERPEYDSDEYVLYKDYLEVIDNTSEEVKEAYRSLFTPDRVIVQESEVDVNPLDIEI
jgi:hypothetical protein